MAWMEMFDQFSNLISAIVGGAIAIFGQIFVVWFQDIPKRQLDEARKSLLLKMLDPSNMPKTTDGSRAKWRNFATLRDVIGADEDTAKRLLIQIGARRSTGTSDLWALIRYQPLPISKDEE